jgi:RHS repeat-associated protein
MKFRLLFILLILSLTASSQEYNYNPSGSLRSDANKQIVSIHYNHLQLPDTIVYADARKIINSYAATGQKIRQQVFEANGVLKKKNDYNNHILFVNDSLKEVQHEEGMMIPLANSASFVYEYHLRDHLGNIRSELTSVPGVASSIADFEGQGYDNARRVNSILFDHTRKGATHFAQRLNGSGNEKYGLARSFSVMPGDTIKMEVFVKYVDPNRKNWTTALNTIMSQVASASTSVGIVIDGGGYGIASATSFPFTGLNGASNDSEKKPKIYLNWLLFDRNYVFKDGGYVKMKGDPKEDGTNVDHEKLSKDLRINYPGYVYIYYSNEEQQPLEAYFDDFAVTQIESIVIQQTDYDPLGLTFNEYHREHTLVNNFLFNGKELQKDFDLNWYDYGARQYDAALGRWHVIDPMASKYSSWTPYNYVINNPMNNVDPDGRDFVTVMDNPSISEEEREKAKKAMHIATTISTGRKIFEKARKDPKVKVFLSFYSARDGALGDTSPVVPYEENDNGLRFHWKEKGGEAKLTVGKSSEDDQLNKIYEALNVTDAVKSNQHIYVVRIRVDAGLSEYTMAEAILHELEAHVNNQIVPFSEIRSFAGKFPQKLILNENTLWEIEGKMEHIMYGQETKVNGRFERYIRYEQSYIPGSTADDVSKEIWKLRHK